MKTQKKPVPVIFWFAATSSQTEKIIFKFKNRIKVLVICGSDKE
jgi:hypothetical protein